MDGRAAAITRELERQLTEKEAEAEAARRELELAGRLQQERSILRLLRLELARGFHSWIEWLDERRRLSAAANRPRSPEKSRGMRSWSAAADEHRQLRSVLTQWHKPAMRRLVHRWRRLSAEARREKEQRQL